jgi:Bacterial membrane protein YfhO
VGYTLRTASLMTDPEYSFDESNPGDYPLFGIGYIITPADMASPVEADKVGCSGDYCLWALPDPGYIHVYDTTGELTATRADVGSQSEALLGSPLLGQQRDLTVAFNGQAASTPTTTDASALEGTPGHVVAQHADLPSGTASAVVHTTRRTTVVLSASYDPGWHATVNGRPAPTVMVAPALVGVVVGAGVHTVTFSYAGYGSYAALFVVAFVVLAALALAPLGWRRLRRSTDARTATTMEGLDEPPRP